ncbi:transcriptional regulator [Sphingobium fuliginis]|uniref:Transcriptional regulator n=1 Tax=Sphingobium fuliginis (strain ATCC 27551) TaxID=336203 RepID=A0A292ZIZ2_SPHSA|nr:transcriptional regulator [Sphingobium fuliginis]
MIEALRTVNTREALVTLMEAMTREMGFRYYALVHHDDLRVKRPDRVDLMDYPAIIMDHLIGQHSYRRDPVIRGCLFAGGAFLWSELHRIVQLDRHDRSSLERGVQAGLNEGITVPYLRIGERIGSCTFAGAHRPDRVGAYLGAAQMIGVFGFQAARRILCGETPAVSSPVKLHPRPRDCIILAGRGFSNKQIARALALTPRTVDGYLTEARRLFGAHDRTELVVSAVLAGEVGLDELRHRQPE